MDKYLANQTSQIMNTAIRCLMKLSKDDMFTESYATLGESAKRINSDPSLRDKIILALDKTSEVIENHGRVSKDREKDSIKHIKSWKDLPNVKVEYNDTRRLKTIAKNTQKELKRTQTENADRSMVDKIMDTYRDHKKAILATIGVSSITIPALISGIIDGYNDAVDDTVDDAINFTKKLEKDVVDGMDPRVASAFGAAYSEVSKDAIDADAAQYSSGIRAVMAARKRGES